MRVTHFTIEAPVEKSVSIALAADLHDADYKRVIEAIENNRPDFIAVPGDVTNSVCEGSKGLLFLKEASKIAPVFFSPGNHERYEDKMKPLIEETGAVLLNNADVRFENITIAGLSSGFGLDRQAAFKKTPVPDLAYLARLTRKNGFKILLCHHPEYYEPYIKSSNIDLILSGHAHGGQWRFFGRGIYAPGQGFFPRYSSGVYDGRLVVSRGLANNTPVARFFNSCELVMIELVPKFIK